MEQRHVWFWFLLAALCSLLPSPAVAQHKNGSLGFSTSFQYTFHGADPNSDNQRIQQGYGVGAGGSIALEGSYRFSYPNWVFGGEVHFSFHGCGVPNDVCESGSTPIMMSVFTSIRYHFLSDDIRPYLDFGIGYWQSLGFIKSNISSFGPTAGFGLDWFVKEDISIGFRTRYGLQLFVGSKGLVPFHQLMGMFTFAVYL